MKMSESFIDFSGVDFSVKDREAIFKFFKIIPIYFSVKEMSLKVKVKIFVQEVKYNKIVNKNPLYVIEIKPSKKISEIVFKMEKAKVVINKEILFSSKRIEFQASLISLSGGGFFVRIYKDPAETFKMTPPKNFKKTIEVKNGDSL